jgi:hypothetical protein
LVPWWIRDVPLAVPAPQPWALSPKVPCRECQLPTTAPPSFVSLNQVARS